MKNNGVNAVSKSYDEWVSFIDLLNESISENQKYFGYMEDYLDSGDQSKRPEEVIVFLNKERGLIWD